MEYNKLRRGKRLVQKVLNDDKNKENAKDINTNFEVTSMRSQQKIVPLTMTNQQETVSFTVSNQQEIVPLTKSNQQETVPFTIISNQQEAVSLTMSNQHEAVPLTLSNQQEKVPFIVLTGDTCYTEDFNPNMDTMFDSLPVDYLSPRFVPSPSCQPAILDFQSNNDYTNDKACFDIPNTPLSPLPCTSLNVPSNRSLSLSPNTPLNALPLSQESPASPSILATNNTAENSADQVAENEDAIFSESDPNNYNMSEGRNRRKKAEPAKWKRNINKKLRREGKAYLGFRKVGRTVVQDTPREERIMKPKCSSNVCLKSKKRHCSLFTEEQRKTIYDRFWSLTWGERKAFVCGSVSRVPTKANTTDSVSRRNYTLKYSLNNGQESYQVCREMFINTLGIGYRMVQAWVCDSSHGIPMTSKDKNTTPNNNLLSQIECLNNFFDNLPKMPSHYNRQNSTKLYLEPVFQTIQEVYNLYKSTCTQALQPAFSRKKFSEVMVQKNISLFNVKKDKCNLCASYETKNIPEEVWKEHTAKKEIARSEKREDIKRAIKGEVILIEVDFQAVKLAPFTHANAFYYKTKLACHNSTIYDVVKKQATCYWFSEDQNNQLVASTFISCLINYLETKCLTSEKKPIVIFSDGCTAQNRNNVMANALLNFSMLHGVFIYQKYLEVGHTQMEVDSVHACIERKLKNKEIKLPSDYVSTTREARKHPTPYEAIELTHDFFKDYTKPLRYNSIRPGRTKNDPMVTDIKVIMYDPSGLIRVKLDFTKDWMDLPHRPKRLHPVDCYPPLFTARCRIPKTKWLHLQELKAVIPQDCHNFYDNLPYQE